MTALLHKSRLIIRSVTYPPVKNLTRYYIPSAGHNNTGKVTYISKTRRVWRRYRLVDFKRILWNSMFFVLRIEYDPNRSAFIALICFLNGILSYVIATQGLEFEKTMYVGYPPKSFLKKIRAGFILPMLYFSEGAFLNTLELNTYRGGTLARAAGTAVTLMKKLFPTQYLMKLPSKEQILLYHRSVGNLGRVTNPNRRFTVYYNAGQKRRLGWKPKVRGVAKNPIDHPHGGGGGKHLVTPWALVAKTRRTRDPHKVSNQIVRSRRLAIRKVVIVKLKKLNRD
jgi:large subunit ribosomal protein L2